MQNALVVKGITKRYDDLIAVHDVWIEVSQGEVFGLLGHNGAGKSTMIECMLGVKSYDEGTVEILGVNPVQHRKSLFEKVGVQFQESSYQDKIMVYELCEITCSLYKDSENWRSLLKAFNLEQMQKRLVSELSGGERQKLSVLLALIPKPSLVFLDELTTGLDSKARREVWRHLEGLKSKGLTIFLTSHYMDEVEALCDRVCILAKGKVIALDTVKALIAKSPYDNLEEAYLWYTGKENSHHENI